MERQEIAAKKITEFFAYRFSLLWMSLTDSILSKNGDQGELGVSGRVSVQNLSSYGNGGATQKTTTQ
ncbi:hypothetical protein E2C01_089015 [Portunus trituberculatus]|uniref:Uncharacterized protein n=1 Tax=Portunus trituberculatus TaxID=210409 RepID=A0A5B7JAV8_PORTR|nr:hypothetical protein [Portunus trituberculatus]